VPRELPRTNHFGFQLAAPDDVRPTRERLRKADVPNGRTTVFSSASRSSIPTATGSNCSHTPSGFTARHLRRDHGRSTPARVCAKQMPYDVWSAIASAVEWLCENWDQADEGIWETRGGRQRFTHSRIMCWVALDRAIRIARDRGFPAARPLVFHRIMERSWSESRQAFVQHEQTDVLDASVLLMPLVGC
jgi:Glycosyl hydrolases family 15